ncbi:UPF0193 protein EVG1 homolog [Cephus cinctus]|uniref:UPF0193 protein EVG1 homolog n=1 Tax=Cephus cinctus TaxID=211228 RepID=A0AAJ7CDV2_CEPCN|nr:UPF0193 protein EVG1 homolog [Cephus cinctus]
MEPRTHRVGIGVGAFHNPPRAKYSEETRNLIKVLMEESKLTTMQRKSVQDAVDKGEPLPTPSSKIHSKKEKYTESQTMFPSVWKKRSQDAIISSGAYERDQYHRTVPLLNKEKEKRHLACIMAYGKDMPPTPHGPKILHKARKELQLPNDVDPLKDLVQGIRERMEFLAEMESLGEGKKYRPIIHQEIAQKIRLIESIDKEKSLEMKEIVGNYKYEQTEAKLFPLGELAIE